MSLKLVYLEHISFLLFSRRDKLTPKKVDNAFDVVDAKKQLQIVLPNVR